MARLPNFSEQSWAGKLGSGGIRLQGSGWPLKGASNPPSQQLANPSEWIHRSEIAGLPGYLLHELIVSGLLVGKPVSEKVSLVGLGKSVPRSRRPVDDIRADVLAAWPPGQDSVTIGVPQAGNSYATNLW